MSAKSNLLIYLEKENISKPEFYKKTGLANGFLDKSDSITSGNLEKLLNVFEDLSSDWLITGRGEMLRDGSKQAVCNSAHAHVGDNSQVRINQSKDTKNINISGNNNVLESRNPVFGPAIGGDIENHGTINYGSMSRDDLIAMMEERFQHLQKKDNQIDAIFEENRILTNECRKLNNEKKELTDRLNKVTDQLLAIILEKSSEK